GANEGCIDRIYQGKPVTCVQNPAAGPESELGQVRRAETPRRVVVGGGGVAGREAATIAAPRAHRVTLIERGRELGGQVLLAARTRERAEYGATGRSAARQVDKLGADRRLGVEPTAEMVLALAPDAVVVATGSHPYRPALPGLDGKHVVTD